MEWAAELVVGAVRVKVTVPYTEVILTFTVAGSLASSLTNAAKFFVGDAQPVSPQSAIANRVNLIFLKL